MVSKFRGRVILNRIVSCCSVAAALLVVTVISPVWAQSDKTGLYGSLSIGPAFLGAMNFAEASTANLNLNPKTGWVFGGALGYRLLENIRVEADVSYTAADLNGTFQQNVQAFVPCGEFEGNPCLAPTVDGDVDSFSALAMVYYDFPVNGPLKPFAGLGIGFADINLDVGTRATLNDGPVSRYSIIDGSDTVMAYRGAVGASYNVGIADLSLAYAYTFTGRPSFAGQGTLVTFDFNRKLNSHSVRLALSYNF